MTALGEHGSCPESGKRRYATEAASEFALEMVQILRWHGEERPRKFYPCTSCDGYHLTRGKKRSKPGDGTRRKKRWKENQRKKKQAGTTLDSKEREQ